MTILPYNLILAQQIRDMPDSFGSLELKDQAVIHPLALAMALLCGTLILMVKRRYAVWPFVILSCFVSDAQRLVLITLDFQLIRVLVAFGLARVLMRTEWSSLRWSALDTCVSLFAIAKLAAYTLQYQAISALIYQCGQLVDSVGLYFLFRCLIRHPRDVYSAATAFALISIPVAAAFLIENQTRHNVFSVFGGVPATTAMREGRLRCQGPFSHPIIAGCFWAASLPLLAALLWRVKLPRVIVVCSLTCSLLIIALTASSTPVMGVLATVFGACMFWTRRWTRWVFLTSCLGAVVLHLSMKAPVWHLISRMTISKGNTGHHRFLLIDHAIHRFSEWWLLGTKSTAHWFYGGQDVTNQFVLEGVRGGALTLGLFLSIVVCAFVAVGRTWRRVQSEPPLLILSWALGVALFTHVVNFIGVSYFGQVVFLWYLHLAMVASMDQFAAERVRPLRRVTVGHRTGASHDACAPVATEDQERLVVHAR